MGSVDKLVMISKVFGLNDLQRMNSRTLDYLEKFGQQKTNKDTIVKKKATKKINEKPPKSQKIVTKLKLPSVTKHI